jgi:glycosyltransferase involved in cell wall biosynthesis
LLPQPIVLPWPGLRILLDYRPALRQRTGVGEYVHEIAAALARRLPPTDELVLFSSSWKDRLAASTPPGRRVDARIPVRVLNALWHRLEAPAIERFAGPVDVAHSGHPLLIPARRARRVVTVHDLDFLDHPERTRGEIRRDYPALAADHAQRADAVVAVSAFTAGEVVRRLGVPRERIVVAGSGAPPWTPRRAAAPRGPILFMGTLEPRKNVGTLLEAYAALLTQRPDAPPLWLAGGATEAAAGWLRAIGEPPLAGRVQHLGYIASDRRYDLYAQASMLVLPSHLEGFGIPVLEAMTVGVPVIVSNRGALPEVAGGAAQIIEPEDAAGLARAMQRYLDDSDAAGAAVERGLARARQYSWDATAATLMELYRDLTARPDSSERATARERAGGRQGAKPPGQQ